MLQDDGWPVVERNGIVSEAVNDSIQWRQDWRASFHENVEAKMDRAPFRTIVALHLVGIACVKYSPFPASSAMLVPVLLLITRIVSRPSLSQALRLNED